MNFPFIPDEEDRIMIEGYMEQIAFLILALFAVVGGLITVTHRHPIYCALGLILCFLSISGFYAMLGAPFLAAVQVIIYAGSIMTLFVFVIMLMDLTQEDLKMPPSKFSTVVASFLGFVLLLEMLMIIGGGFLTGKMGSWTPEKVDSVGHTRVLAQVLFTEYLYPFEIISFVLVVALVGAILLGKKKLHLGGKE